MESRNRQHGITFLELLLVVFITLKLCGVITWSWWWVMAPAWGAVAIILVVAMVTLVVAVVAEMADKRRYRRK